MNFSEYAKQIEALGRELSLEALGGTRAVIEPLLPADMLDGVDVVRDIHYGEHDRHRLDVFTKAGESHLKPVLLFVHGGGFIAGDKHSEGSPFYSNIPAWAVKNGFAGVNMTYRLAPDHPWPAGSEDIHQAVAWIHANGHSHGLDANNIILMGQSAGGAHTACYLAHPDVRNGKPHGLKGAVLLSAVYDYVTMPTTEKELAYVGPDETLYHQRSSLEGMLEVDIPLLVTMAEFDPPAFHAQTLKFLYAWQEKHGDLPWFVHMLGQNHLSVALYLGLEGDLLGPQLKRFMHEHFS